MSETTSQTTNQTSDTEEGARKGSIASVGRRLQAARRGLKLTTRQVATELRIREEYIKAIEKDDFENLPSPVYVTGFIRSYARHLGLDAELLLEEMREAGMLAQEVHHNRRTPVQEGTLPGRHAVLIALIVAVAAGGAWQGMNWVKAHQAHELDARTQKAQPLDGAVKHTESTQVVAAHLVPVESKPENTAQTARTAPDVMASTTAEKTVPATPAATVAATPSATAQNVPTPTDTQPVGAHVRLVANQAVWVEIRQPKQGRVLVARTLASGESLWVKPWKDAVLDVGLPPALDVEIDGKNMGAVGVAGHKVRNLPLDVASLQTYYTKGENTRPADDATATDTTDTDQKTGAGSFYPWAQPGVGNH